MYSYLCRQCPDCKTEYVLGRVPNPGSGDSNSTIGSRVNNTCPNCQTLFLPENYYVVQSVNPIEERPTGQAAASGSLE